MKYGVECSEDNNISSMADPFQQHVHTVRIPTENDDLANMEGKGIRQQAKMVNFTCYRIACHVIAIK